MAAECSKFNAISAKVAIQRIFFIYPIYPCNMLFDFSTDYYLASIYIINSNIVISKYRIPLRINIKFCGVS